MSAMQIIKDKLFHLFDEGEFKKALLGDEDFFWRDDLVGGHSIRSVIPYFFEWYFLYGSQKSILEIKRIFIEEIQNNKSLNNYNNSLNSIVLVRVYCVDANKEGNWILEKEFILQLLFDCISRFSNEELITLNIKRDIEAITKFLPEAQKVCNVINERLSPRSA